MALRHPRRRWQSILFDVLVVGGVGVLGVFWGLSGTNDLAQHVALAVLMGGALLVRRRWPVSVMAAVSTLALAQVLIHVRVAFYDVAVLIAMYSVVKYARWVWTAYLAAFVAGIGVTMLTVQYHSIQEGFTFAAVCAAVWLTGYVLRTRRLYVESLEERAATAERERDHLAKLAAADERAGIARELHDVVAHSLAVMIVQADGASYALDNDPGQARGAMQTIAATGRDALEDMRRIVGVLRGTAAADGDTERRRITLDQLDALVDRARSAGLRVHLTATGEAEGLSPADELTVFRLAQEALTNALRHAGQGAVVSVALTYARGSVSLEVVDDGAGRLVTVGGGGGGALVPSGGHGLVGMRERVAVHGGEFSAGPRLGGGWQVRAVVPVKGVV